MIFGFHRRQVIANIKRNVAEKQFNSKAELHDPVLNKEQTNNIVKKYWKHTASVGYRMINLVIRCVFALASQILTGRCKIEGLENLPDTPNAFERLYIVVEASNLAMPHLIGWAVRNFDSLPIDTNLHYLSRVFPEKLKKAMAKPCWILIYPEQELWFNYRKPRPLKKGAYYYAAKLYQPIVSTFTEIRSTSKREMFHRDFYKTRKVLHVLPTIYPDKNLKISENVNKMWRTDYKQKKAACEKCYGKKLTDDFSYDDIAGFSPKKK